MSRPTREGGGSARPWSPLPAAPPPPAAAAGVSGGAGPGARHPTSPGRQRTADPATAARTPGQPRQPSPIRPVFETRAGRSKGPLVGLEPVEFLLVGQPLLMRRTTRPLLERMGAVEVHEATDAAGAKELLEQRPGINFIIQEWQLPDRKGAELLRQLREEARWGFLPILVMTSVDTPGEVALAAELGATAWLVTPFSVLTFGRQVERICRVHFGQDQVTTLLRRGFRLLQRRETEPARLVFEKVVELQPANPQGHYGLGEANLLRGELALARRHFEQAVAQAPNFLKGHKRLARVLHDQADSAGEVQHLEQVVRVSPLSVATRVDLARGYRRLGREDAAEQMLRQTLRIDNRHVEALEEISGLFMHQGRFDEASSVLDRVNVPADEVLLNNLGIAQRMQGKYSQAEETYKRAIRQCGEDPVLAHNLAIVYRRWGRNDDCRVWLLRALEVDPGMKEAAELLEQLAVEARAQAQLPSAQGAPTGDGGR